MSIYVSIHNDSDKSIVEEYECYYCDGQKCDRCKQTGKDIFRSSKWSMNLSNGNFSTFASALGLPVNACGGTWDARIVLKALKSLNPELSVRTAHQEGNMIDCGIDIDYVTRRVETLLMIALEAARREELVCWG